MMTPTMINLSLPHWPNEKNKSETHFSVFNTQRNTIIKKKSVSWKGSEQKKRKEKKRNMAKRSSTDEQATPPTESTLIIDQGEDTTLTYIVLNDRLPERFEEVVGFFLAGKWKVDKNYEWVELWTDWTAAWKAETKANSPGDGGVIDVKTRITRVYHVVSYF
jgi:hypothetical protein